MNTIISQLLDVDKEARLMLDEAQQYYDKTLEELAAEKKRLLEQYEWKAADHLGGVSQSEQTGASEEIAALWRHHAERTAAMDAVFASQRQSWEDELVRRCLGR